MRVLSGLWRAVVAAFRFGRKPKPRKTDEDEPTIYPMW